MTYPSNDRDSWPNMAETEWDDDGVSVDGTHAISIVHIGGFRAHNEPIPFVQSAACAYCNRWAVAFRVGVNVTADGPLTKPIDRRMELTLIYVCDQHQGDADNELLDTYGSSDSSLGDKLELALKVEKWYSR